MGWIARITGLLQQLASPGEAGVLPGFEESARRLQAVPSRSGSKLPDEHDLLLGSYCDDVHPVGQVGDEEVVSLAAGTRTEPLATQAEQPGLAQSLVVRTVPVGNPRRFRRGDPGRAETSEE